ncbi:helix-turn-helix domain-containing protein [Parabacteroides sp.]
MDSVVSLKEYNELKSIMLDIKEMVSTLVNQDRQELLTPKEVCKILKIGRSTYQRYVDAGVLEQIQIGKNNSRAYVKRLELERLIDEGKL